MESRSEGLHGLLMELMRTLGALQAQNASVGSTLSVSQIFALHELDTDVPLSQSELAQRLHLEKSSVSRLAAELEERGLLVRERDPSNRRVYRLRLTARGRAMHADLSSSLHPYYERWVAEMAPDEVDALLTGLSAFVRAMRAAPPGRPGQ